MDRSVRKLQVVILLGLILLMQIVLRAPFLNEPFDREEGASAYVGARILNGEVPYRDVTAYDSPGIYYVYALTFKVLVSSLAAVRGVTLVVSLISTLAIFLAGYLLLGSVGGLLAAFFFALFAGGPFIGGAAACPENFWIVCITFAFAGALYKGRDWVAGMSGLSLGAAVIFKLSSLIFFPLFLGAAFYFFNRRQKQYFFGAFLALPLIAGGYFLSRGAIFNLLYDLLVVPLNYWHSPFNPEAVYKTFFLMINENGILWILGFSGMLYVFLRDRRPASLWLAFFALLSLLSVFISADHSGPRYLLLLPALVLVSAYAIMSWRAASPNLLANIFGFVVLAYLFFSVAYIQYPFYLVYSPEKISQEKNGHNNFNLAVEVGQELKKNSNPQDLIYICGPEPEIYFYAQRRSPARLPYVPEGASLNLNPGKRNEVLSQLSARPPRFIVWTMPIYQCVDLFGFTVGHYKLAAEVCGWRIYEKI